MRLMQPSPAERGSGVPAGRCHETASKQRGRDHLCLLEQIHDHSVCTPLPKIGPTTRPPCRKELAFRLYESIANTPWVFHPCGPDHLLFQRCFSQITCCDTRAQVSPGGSEARKTSAEWLPCNTCLIPPLRFPYPPCTMGSPPATSCIRATGEYNARKGDLYPGGHRPECFSSEDFKAVPLSSLRCGWRQGQRRAPIFDPASQRLCAHCQG